MVDTIYRSGMARPRIAKPTLTTLEELRRRTGLGRARYAELLTIAPSLVTKRRGVPPEAVVRAERLAEQHAEFLESVRNAIDRERPMATIDNRPCMSTRQVADVLGLGEYHISNLRDRGFLPSRKLGRTTVYDVDNIRALVEQRDPRTFQSPLQSAFLRYLDRQELREASA